MSEPKRTDSSPTDMNVYGYCVVYRKEGQWTVDQCDEYANLPAHYPFLAEALDRVAYLRERDIDCRVAALIAEKSDTPEEFERNKINEEESEE